MATQGDIALTGGASNILNLVKAFKGVKTTETQTTKPDITQQGMDAILQKLLTGSQGLASVASGQKLAGLYDSTTNMMLINDLMSRTAGELAKAQAGTTVTKTSTTDPLLRGSDVATGLGLTAAAQLLGPSLSALLGGANGGALSKGGAALKDLLFGSKVGSGGIGGTAGTAGAADADVAGGMLPEFGSSSAYDAAITALIKGEVDPTFMDFDTAVFDTTSNSSTSDAVSMLLSQLAGLPSNTVSANGLSSSAATDISNSAAAVDINPWADIDAQISALMGELGISFEGLDFGNFNLDDLLGQLDFGELDFDSNYPD